MEFKFPLKQHVGGPCVPVVEVSDEVKRGQKIAEPNGLGAYIHSSVTGTVKLVSDVEIVIEAEEEQSKDYLPIKETDDALEAIKEAGIVGAGGAGFPAHVKLKTKIPGGYVIVNAAECEPILGHNNHNLEEHAEKIVRGTKIVMNIKEAEHVIIAIKPKQAEDLDE